MKRARMYLMALIGFGGILVLTSVSEAQQPGGAPGVAPGGAPGSQPPAPSGRPTIAVFNMAAVMKDYGKAKYKVYELNEERKKLSGDLISKRGIYIQLQQDIQKQQNPTLKDALVKQQVDLARQIEDMDRDINKKLNDKASLIISSLYDEIKSVVDATAEMNGYHIVFAYPDAASADDMKNPFMKELKLKPPAAQPFYVAKQVDITGIVIQTLNTWYPSPPVPAQPATSEPNRPTTTTPPQGSPVPGGPPR